MVYLGLNCALLLFNLRLWLTANTSAPVNDQRHSLDRVTYADYDFSKARRSGVKLRHIDLSKGEESIGRRIKLKENQPPISNKDIVHKWRAHHGNDTPVVPLSDVYVTPIPIKKIADVSFSAVRDQYEIPKIQYTELVNCAKLLKNDSKELTKAKQTMASRPFFKIPIYEEIYLNWTTDCERFKESRGYIQVPLSQEEEEFPLAFSIAMYTDVEQTERLLRAIYQPQNFYCIHIDTKSPLLVHRTVRAIADCFPNVWVASHLDKIKWGDVSILLPEINCMRDLVKYYPKKKWKYFINLTGQEFPLRTNYELVKIAKIFNGSNDIGGSQSL